MEAIGISFKNQSLKAAHLRKERSTTFLSVKEIPLSKEGVKQLYKSPTPLPEIKSVREGIAFLKTTALSMRNWLFKREGLLIATLLSSRNVFVRRLSLPVSGKRNALAALPFQLEGIIPFPVEHSIIAASITPEGKEGSSATVFATTSEALSSHLEQCRQFLENTPDHVTCEPAALRRFIHWVFPEEQGKILLLHMLDKEKIIALLVEREELLFSQTLSLSSSLEKEEEKLVMFLKQKGFRPEEISWLYTGEAIARNSPSPFPGPKLHLSPIDHYPAEQVAVYALEIGTALEALDNDFYQIQFCNGELTPASQQEKRKKQTVVYFLVCAFFALLMAISSSLFIRAKETRLSDHLRSLLPETLQGKPMTTLSQMQVQLDSWERSLGKQHIAFSLIPSVPKVSDLLAWLSTHPSFSLPDGGKKEGIDLKAIHYQLVKYPKVQETSSPYQGQVTLEFTAQTPRLAREFHDALLKGDALVNPKKEVKWEVDNNTYRTSFELNQVGGS
jgi:type IV pilus assembly protein PilM